MRFQRGLFALLTVGLAGCHHHHPAPVMMEACDSVPATPASQMDLSALAGEYRVTFVAKAGLRSGHWVAGTLSLRAQDPSLVTLDRRDGTVITQPFIGQLDLALDSVGAVRMGDAMSSDGSMPGVGLYVNHHPNGEAADVFGRVGSQSNARGQGPIDAGYFSFFVRRVTPDGIRGNWTSAPGTSAGLRTPNATGFFCADRAR